LTCSQSATARRWRGNRPSRQPFAFHFNYGFLSEGRAWLATLLERDVDAEPTLERAQALSCAAVLAAEEGDYEVARAYADECFGLPASLTTASVEAVANDALGTAALHQGDLAGARAFYTRAVRLSRAAGEVSYSLYLTQLGDVALQERDLDRAQRIYEEALAEANPGGVLPAVGLALNGLATVAWRKHDSARAELLLEQGVTLLDQLSALPHAVHTMLVALGHMALERKDVDRARERFLEALGRASRAGHRRTVDAALKGIGLLSRDEAAA
jgi:tetratricopeptide (TPR) repeat protein